MVHLSRHERATRSEGIPRMPPMYGALLARGAMCGDYQVETLIGAGGCGRVYLARHRVLRRAAAVKVLSLELAVSASAYQRFVFEAQAANRVVHPGIVDVHDFGRLADGRPYFAMEVLDGETVEERVVGDGRIAPAAVLDVAERLADVLMAVHGAGVVHRDVKPSNVFLHGEAQTVKLLDFGIAKLIAPEPGETAVVTTATTRVGTPEAMAPEQIRGLPVDPRTDQYGLGILVYRALTGAWPFEADDPFEVERLHLEATAVPPSQRAPLPRAVDVVVARCLAKDPDDRFVHPGAAVEALRRALA